MYGTCICIFKRAVLSVRNRKLLLRKDTWDGDKSSCHVLLQKELIAWLILCSQGSMSDPAELPGLAHFCEHMLFLGTEKVRILS